MTIDQVEEWFGSLYRVCKDLKIAPQNATKWNRKGYIPWKQQFRIAMLTEGALMPDDEDPNLIRPKNKKATTSP